MLEDDINNLLLVCNLSCSITIAYAYRSTT